MPMNRILALGLNPAYQKTIRLNRLIAGGVNRATECRVSASGKGINFIRAAHLWGRAEAVVLQPLGGVVGDLLSEALARENLSAVTIRTAGCTRTCSTLLCDSSESATEIIEPSAQLSESESAALFDAMEKILPEVQGLALCGTVPPGIAPEFFRDAIRLARARGIPVLLDAYREIRGLLSEGLSFLKINGEELSHLAECQTITPERIAQFREAHGIAVLAVTNGAEPAFLSTQEGLFRIAVPRLKECRNPIGAGDTCDAVLFSETLEGTPVPEAFALGLAAASASCMTREPAFFDPGEARKLCRQTVIERI